MPRIRQSGRNKCTHKYSCVSCVPQTGQRKCCTTAETPGSNCANGEWETWLWLEAWGKFLCDPGHVSWPARWDSSDNSLRHSPKSRGLGCLSCQQSWCFNSITQPSIPCTWWGAAPRSVSLLTPSPEAVNKKPRLELHHSCFPQSLKVFQKTGLKLNLMSCASFYLWTSGLKSSWLIFQRFGVVSQGGVSFSNEWIFT